MILPPGYFIIWIAMADEDLTTTQYGTSSGLCTISSLKHVSNPAEIMYLDSPETHAGIDFLL
jgi:hypothetical protein